MSRTLFSKLFAALAVFALAIFVAACGGGGSSSSESTTAEGTAESTEAESNGEPLTVGSDIPYPPFEEGKAGEYTGFDIELIEAIGEKIGRPGRSAGHVVRNACSATSARASSTQAISAATITEEREEAVDFSNPYYLSEQAILVKEGSEIKGLKDLEGKTVGVQQGTTGQELAKEKSGSSEIRPYPEGPDAVNALKAGQVEAVIIDAPVAQNAVEKTGGVEIAEDVQPRSGAGGRIMAITFDDLPKSIGFEDVDGARRTTDSHSSRAQSAQGAGDRLRE